MISTAADVPGIRDIGSGRRGFVAAGVALRRILHGDIRPAGHAGNLQ